MEKLLEQIRECRICAPYLVNGVRPVLSAGAESRLVVVGQAPGRIVHAGGIPWDDKSGENLRGWLGMDRAEFYDTGRLALMPMGFCYPGTGTSGDLPPRPECAPLWHPRLLDAMPQVRLILLVGLYAQQYYLREAAESTLTGTVRNFRAYLPRYFPLPHPSPRNNIWQARNPWFAREVLPELKKQVRSLWNT